MLPLKTLIDSIFRKCCKSVRWQGAKKQQDRRVLPVREDLIFFKQRNQRAILQCFPNLSA